jgi:hypothetical protein
MGGRFHSALGDHDTLQQFWILVNATVTRVGHGSHDSLLCTSSRSPLFRHRAGSNTIGVDDLRSQWRSVVFLICAIIRGAARLKIATLRRFLRLSREPALNFLSMRLHGRSLASCVLMVAAHREGRAYCFFLCSWIAIVRFLNRLHTSTQHHTSAATFLGRMRLQNMASARLSSSAPCFTKSPIGLDRQTAWGSWSLARSQLFMWCGERVGWMS